MFRRSRHHLLRATRRRLSPIAPPSSAILNDPSLFPLSPALVSQYREDGFLVLRNVFSPAAFSTLTAAAEEAAARRGDRLIPTGRGHEVELDITVKNPEGVPDPPKNPETGEFEPVKPKLRKQRMMARFKSEKSFERAKDRMHRAKARSIERRGIDPQEILQDKVKAEEYGAAYERYLQSDEFRNDVIHKMHVKELTQFLDSSARGWLHLWHADADLHEVVRGPIGKTLAQASAELGGFVRARLFTDQLARWKPWGNAQAMHCSAPFVDFLDPRAVNASVVLPGGNIGPGRGGVVILPGSHHALREITHEGTDLAMLRSMPAAWDTGEWVRNIPALQKIKPVSLKLEPGDCFLVNSLTVLGHYPNMSTETPTVYSAMMMPDGVVYNGQRLSWMAQEHGPLQYYEAGEPLKDEGLFPVLHSVLGDDDDDFM